jgi:hypothetical protein
MSLNFSSTFKECVAKSKNSWGIFFFFRAQIRAYEWDKGKKGYKKWSQAKFLWADDECLQAPLHHWIARSHLHLESWENTNKSNLNMVFFAWSTLFFIKRFMEIRTCKKEKGLEKVMVSPNSCGLLICDHWIARNHLNHKFVRMEEPNPSLQFSLTHTTSKLQFVACTYNVFCYLV